MRIGASKSKSMFDKAYELECLIDATYKTSNWAYIYVDNTKLQHADAIFLDYIYSSLWFGY